jgi:lipopolysaccharide export system protein LptC
MLLFQWFWTRTAALLALAICASATPGCRAGRPTEAEAVVPELKLEQVRFRVYRGETLRASGNADQMTLRRDSTDITAQNLVALLRSNEGEPTRVTAARGAGVLATRHFQATDGVTVARGDDVARTHSARYEPEGGSGEGLVRGDEPVVVQGKGYQLEGPRFTLDPAIGVIDIDGGTKLVAGTGAAR